MRMKGRAGDGRGAVLMQEARVRLVCGEEGAVDVEGLDLVAVGARDEDGCVLVDAERAQRVARGGDCVDRIVHAQVPKPHLAVAAAREELPDAAALHVHVGDPLLVLAPHLDHCRRWFEALVEHPDGSVAKPGNEDVARNLV